MNKKGTGLTVYTIVWSIAIPMLFLAMVFTFQACSSNTQGFNAVVRHETLVNRFINDICKNV